jgi:transcriptional regulator with GAF, ATPase, and Fis domain
MNIKDSPADVFSPKHLHGERSSDAAGGFRDNDLPFALSAQVLSQSDEIVGQSEHILSIKQYIDRVAPSEAAVLITGETGTGKELFARRVHRKSNRSNGPFISVNCAAIPDNLLESELFGFEKGAFTGAMSRHAGRFVEADKGTLFLDEIGDLSLAAQAKLLRVLEQKTVQPLGSRGTRAIDFRLVAATNRNLEQMVADGDFRQDLFYRIDVIHVHIAPLRDRRQDIVSLANYFIRALDLQYCRRFVALTTGAQSHLTDCPWPGNARELRNVIERAAVLSNSEYITEQDIAGRFHFSECRYESSSTRISSSFRADPNEGHRYRTSHTGYDRTTINWSDVSAVEQLRKTLEETRWNKSKTAKILQCSRMTVHRKVVEFELGPSGLTPRTKNPSTKMSKAAAQYIA